MTGTTNINEQEMTTELRRIVAEVGGIPDTFDPQAHFYNDLGIPSVKALHLLVALEERFDIQIQDDEFVDATSLDKLLALITRLVR